MCVEWIKKRAIAVDMCQDENDFRCEQKTVLNFIYIKEIFDDENVTISNVSFTHS